MKQAKELDYFNRESHLHESIVQLIHDPRIMTILIWNIVRWNPENIQKV